MQNLLIQNPRFDLPTPSSHTQPSAGPAPLNPACLPRLWVPAAKPATHRSGPGAAGPRGTSTQVLAEQGVRGPQEAPAAAGDAA